MTRPDPRAAGGWAPRYEPALLTGVLTPRVCEETVARAHEIGFEPSPVFHGDEPAQNESYRRSETAWLTPDDSAGIYETVKSTLLSANDEFYRFAIYGMDQIQIIRYEPGCFFVDHTDIAHAHAAHRKISLLVQLSSPDDYEGGDVVLANRLTVPKSLGAGTIFPAWVQHRVDPITSGTRYSLAAWAKGAWFN